MEKIYLAVAYGGSYDESWERIVVASTNADKIRRYVEEQTARVERLKDVEIKTDSFAVDYDTLHPLDHSIMESLVNLPKWPAGIDQRLITREMRAERNSIRALNDEISTRNRTRVTEHTARRNEALLAFAISVGLNLDDLPDAGVLRMANAPGITSLLYRATDISYRIDEVDTI